MRFSLTSLVRLVAFAALGLSAVAVGLSRAVPRVSVFRDLAPPRYYGANGSIFTPPDPRNFLIDTATGRVEAAEFGPGESLEYVACSPWTVSGDYELAGRLSVWEKTGPRTLCGNPSLARYAMPGREPRGQVETVPMIAGRPCWLPGHPSQMLLALGDGLLHRINLGGEAGDPLARPEPGATGGTVPLEWACPFPGEGRPILSDPISPPIRALDGRVFVALCPRVSGRQRRSFAPAQLWWLRLDPSGASIVAAGRVTVPTTQDIWTSAEERLPNLAVAPDGRVVIAYLGRVRGESGWRLKVAPLRLDPKSGDPTVAPEDVREVAVDCAVTVPPFSPDGLWVYSIERVFSDDGPKVERVAVLEALGDPDGAPKRGGAGRAEHPAVAARRTPPGG
jgi:hypothetical protein